MNRKEPFQVSGRGLMVAALAAALFGIGGDAHAQAAWQNCGAGASSICLPTGSLGIGTTSPQNKIHVQNGGANTFTYLEVNNFTTAVGYTAGLNMSQSNSNTPGVLSTTVNGQYLAEWSFRGVDANNNWRQAAIMDVLQDGAAGASGVPGKYTFLTGDGGAQGPLVRMTIKGNGNIGIGTTTPTALLDVAGNTMIRGDISVNGNIAAKYQDLAEWVPANEELAAGTVVVLDSEKPNTVLASSSPYDGSVAGVISSQPGIILGTEAAGHVKVATTGRVKVRVDASRGAIKIGDLLVTGERAGTAMKSTPFDVGGTKIHRPGTILGKALEPLASGEGEILVLLSLQ